MAKEFPTSQAFREIADDVNAIGRFPMAIFVPEHLIMEK